MSVNFAINTVRAVVNDFGPGCGTVNPGTHPNHPPVECSIDGCWTAAVSLSWLPLPPPPPPPAPYSPGGDPSPTDPHHHVHAEE